MNRWPPTLAHLWKTTRCTLLTSTLGDCATPGPLSATRSFCRTTRDSTCTETSWQCCQCSNKPSMFFRWKLTLIIYILLYADFRHFKIITTQYLMEHYNGALESCTVGRKTQNTVEQYSSEKWIFFCYNELFLFSGDSRGDLSGCADHWSILLRGWPADPLCRLHWGSGRKPARLPSSVHRQNHQLPQAQAAGLSVEEGWAGRQRHRQEEVHIVPKSIYILSMFPICQGMFTYVVTVY